MLILLSNPLHSQTTVQADIGYSITLPAKWVQQKESNIDYSYYDSSLTYKAFFWISVFNFNQSNFSPQGAWTKAALTNHLLDVENSINPFGVTIYLDSSKNPKISDKWAPEAFSVYRAGDAVKSDFSEFVIFTEMNNAGYQISIVGDSLDVRNNIRYYIDILGSIAIDSVYFAGIERENKSILNHRPVGRNDGQLYSITGERFKNENRKFQVYYRAKTAGLNGELKK